MKLEGPLMSIGAHGTIAKAVTYSMRGGRARASIYRPPPDARTQTQLNQRAHYLDGTRLWKLMTDADRLAWTQTHQLPNASGYNTFVQTIIRRITRNRDWLHEDFFSSDRALQNFILVHLMETYAGSSFLDISGHHRDWAPTDTTQEQGDRGQAALLGNAPDNLTLENSANLGSKPALTIALRIYSNTAQGDMDGNVAIISNYNYAYDAGFFIEVRLSRFRFRVGDGTRQPDLTAIIVYTPGMWNTLIATFEAADSGRQRFILNGREIASQTTDATQVATSPTAITLGGSGAGTKFPGYIDNAIVYAGATNALRV